MHCWRKLAVNWVSRGWGRGSASPRLASSPATPALDAQALEFQAAVPAILVECRWRRAGERERPSSPTYGADPAAPAGPSSRRPGNGSDSTQAGHARARWHCWRRRPRRPSSATRFRTLRTTSPSKSVLHGRVSRRRTRHCAANAASASAQTHWIDSICYSRHVGRGAVPPGSQRRGARRVRSGVPDFAGVSELAAAGEVSATIGADCDRIRIAARRVPPWGQQLAQRS